MKLYLIRIYRNNEDIRNEELAKIISKNEGMIYQQTIEETMKYLITFAFKTREQRENVSEKMQQIRYEYEEVEEDDILIKETVKMESTIYTGYERKKRKSEKTEKILENILKERNIKYFKTILKDEIFYDFKNKYNELSAIVIRNNNKYIGLQKGYGIYIYNKKKQYKEALEFIVKTETGENEETK